MEGLGNHSYKWLSRALKVLSNGPNLIFLGGISFSEYLSCKMLNQKQVFQACEFSHVIGSINNLLEQLQLLINNCIDY